MKNNLRTIGVLIAVFLFSLGFSGCNSDDEESTPTPTPTPTPTATKFMTCKVDGVAWASDTSSTKLAGSIMNNVIVVSGIASNGTGIVIRLGGTTTGTYTLNQTSTTNAGLFNPDQSGTTPAYATNQSASAGGTVVITSIDATNKKISGTFSFIVAKAMDGTSKNITQGEFRNVPYTTSLPPTSSTFSVSIDGTLFTASSITASLIGGKIAISGMNGNASVRLFIIEPPTLGSHALSMFGDYTGQYSPNTSTILSSNPGTVNITSFNSSTKNIKGTFSFSAADIYGVVGATLTNGQFDVTYN